MRVEYAHIRSYTSALHTAHASDVDLIVHVGMADGWDFVSMERRAYKQGFTSCWGGRGGFGKYYVIKDAAGKNINDTGECPWGEDVPVGLCTGLDVDGVVEGAKGLLERCESVSSREIKAHEDAGTYCCGFIYYESLANKVSLFPLQSLLFFLASVKYSLRFTQAMNSLQETLLTRPSTQNKHQQRSCSATFQATLIQRTSKQVPTLFAPSSVLLLLKYSKPVFWKESPRTAGPGRVSLMQRKPRPCR